MQLFCLHTQSPLQLACAEVCRKINRRIADGQLFDQMGRRVSRPLESALVNREASYAYAVVNGIPQMLEEESIPLCESLSDE